MADTILTPPAPAEGEGTAASEAPAAAAPETPPAPPVEPTQQGEPPKQEGEAKADTAAPVDVKLPEGVTLDEGLLTAIKGGKPQEIADAYLAAQTKAEEARTSAWEQKQAGWVEELKADKEIGGTNWDASVKHAQRWMGKYADAELRQLLTDSGFGNHPAFVRAFIRAGKGLAEDTVAGTGGGKPAGTSQDPFFSIYTTMQKE